MDIDEGSGRSEYKDLTSRHGEPYWAGLAIFLLGLALGFGFGYMGGDNAAYHEYIKQLDARPKCR